MEPMQGDRILVATDGSESAFQTVLYLSSLNEFKKREMVLFGIYEGVPDCYYDITSSPASFYSYEIVKKFAEDQRSFLEAGLENAKKSLTMSGFSPDRVTVKVQQRVSGIARDIIAEARNGYSLVIAGRKGLKRLESVIFGNVASKLIEKLSFTSLLLVGKGALPGKLLAAVDGSDASWKMIDFLAKNLAGQGFRALTLLHVSRWESTGSSRTPQEIEALQQFRQKMETTLEGMAAKLVSAGFSPSAVDWRILTNKASRAEAILDYARNTGYSSIALGRKGLSNVPDFSMGRVSSKVIQLSRGLAVWLIS